ncbi:MAG: lytic transglycosylase domain-containing protein [Nitrospiria bacterium]
MFLSLVSVVYLPLMTTPPDFPSGSESGWPGKIVTLTDSTPSGKSAGPDFPDSLSVADQKYSGFERFLEPSGVKMERIHWILKDFRTGLPAVEVQKLAHLIYQESFQYQYDPELILAVIVTESSFYNWSRSRVGAIGLMQIMPTTGFSLAKAGNINWMGIATLFDPYLNIKLGIKYLAMMHDQFDDLEIALTAYNYGPTRVSEMLKRCERLPRDYSQKVLSNYKRFLELEPGDPVVS